MSLVRSVVALVLLMVVCLSAGAFGAVFTAPAIPEWYAHLRKPPWTPPGALFGPVWTALYAMMACAAWLVWRKAGLGGATLALVLFGVQLLLNAAWSPAFFGLRSPLLGLAIIVPLWCAIAATIAAFWRHSFPAAALLLPYLLWVSFATALNFAIWRLNG